VRRLTLVRDGARRPEAAADEQVLAASEVKPWVLRGRAATSLARYRESRVLTPDLTYLGRPLALGLLARWCARGLCYIEDELGQRRPLTITQLARWSAALLREPLQRGAYVSAFAAAVDREEADVAARPRLTVAHGVPCAYFRTDLSYSVKAGGSVGHIAGVLNNLGTLGHTPFFVTTDRVPTVSPDIETLLVPRSERFWHYRELPAMVMHDTFLRHARQALHGRPLGFIYQRYSLHNFTGVVLSRERRVPLVIEYNGSESWVGRYWGHPLQHSALADRIELLNIRAADVVTVVSDVIRSELVARGAPAERILVNPNGVDTERYHPQVDGTAVRRRLGLEGMCVIGFIGTFGPWHGAEVLARAFGQWLDRRPAVKASTRLLMIGDGARAASARQLLASSGHLDASVWTGLVPQAEGPEYLAACDILVSPHVPNPDGSRFFGSPTKLFEYMAMGRAIVASDLEQIGATLQHDDTAWLVPPGDAGALALALDGLAADADVRARLGAAARRVAVGRWSWHEHTRRIVEALHSSRRPAAKEMGSRD
jgi:glycosyltransferase involved in cell wall biosynthesis